MSAATVTTPTIEALLPSEAATRQLAVELAAMLEPGDVIALSGGLGSGKTTFARTLIRHLAGDPLMEVPSPTFTLVQTYDLPAYPLLHVDLYRIGGEGELLELGLADLFHGAVSLIEWPERAGHALPPATLSIEFALAPERGPEARRVRIGSARPLPRGVERQFAFDRFMEEAGFAHARRVPIQGDASTRIYERLERGDRNAILMIAPRRPDGPPVRDGRPYSRIAHLAEDVAPFVAMARALRQRGLSAPEVLDADLGEGWLILEDLGAEGVVTGDPPQIVEERYTAALDVLVTLHGDKLPNLLPVAPSVNYHLPRYDADAFLIEAELLIDWYFPQQGRLASAELRAAFLSLWQEMLAPALSAPPTWVLRDYHSPNLLWLPQRQGIARVGVLDFQDALMGPAAYDVVSLLQDARVDVPVPFEDDLLSRYLKGRRAIERDFDMVRFVELYGLLGAQRATKVLGIFARLDRRDGKPQYLRHQPRVWRNLRRSLAHPSLAKLKAWYDVHVPPPRTP